MFSVDSYSKMSAKLTSMVSLKTISVYQYLISTSKVTIQLSYIYYDSVFF